MPCFAAVALSLCGCEGARTAADAKRNAAPSAVQISYDATSACINRRTFINDVLPANAGEFGTRGLDRTYWGGIKMRTKAPATSWGPGFYPSWGRHQYDTFMGDETDGTGLPDPFQIVADRDAPGAPRALRIAAMPIPPELATSLVIMQNDQYVVTSASQSFQVPSDGESLSVEVADPSSAQNGWNVGMGYRGADTTFIGTLTSGGASGSGGGSNPWTISNLRVYAGEPGATIEPGSNDEGGFRSYTFPHYYSGTLDANVDQQYGFFAARLRFPKGLPGLSPAFWMLETGGVGTNAGKPLKSEWDVAEQFADTEGDDLNAGNILWNSTRTGPWFSYGCGMKCGDGSNTTAPGSTGVYPWPSTGTDTIEYHDYGVLIGPGGAPKPAQDVYGGGTFVEDNSPWSGTTFFLDGKPIAGHIGQPDLTQGSPDKEIMAMFQIGAPGTFLDPDGRAASNPWPQYLYVQWIRAYRPTTRPC